MGWILLAIIVGAVAFAISIYNRLVASRNRFKNAFAQIDVQLKRRYDIIPNLVETAKGYLKHERETLDAVIQARNGASNSLAAAWLMLITRCFMSVAITPSCMLERTASFLLR